MRIEAYSQIQNLYNVSRPAAKAEKPGVPDFKDKLSISGAGRDLQVAKQAVAAAADVREDRIAELRTSYQNGTYDVSASDFADKILERFAQTAF
ncbi:MAG: flagellar biosynthesis anti-sigma factor FlgM [Lachnospiraceae bacterium]|jgi:negative regulator of flagellin synthesis FlgM|nr:flagellar biosynthesis anti-sigma factor FlgM [Lachnospiraceae bacterium]